MAGFVGAALLKGSRRMRPEPVSPPDAEAPSLPGKMGKGAMGRLGNIARNAKMRAGRRQAKRSRRGY